MRLKWKLVSVHLEIVLILMQDKCTVCVEHTICSEIILDGPDGTPRWRGSFGISLPSVWRQALVSVQDRCMVCAGRTIGLEIVLDAPMVPLGDEAQVEARFGPFGHSANLDTR